MAAVEVQPSCEAYAQLHRAACEVGEDVRGHKGFMEIVAGSNDGLELAASVLSEGALRSRI